MQQQHQGSGDNIAGNKIVNLLFSKTVVIIAGLILVLGGVILMWFTDYLSQEYLVSGVVREYAGEPSVGTSVDLYINGAERHSLTTNEQGRFEYLTESMPDQLTVLALDKQDTLFQKQYDQADLEQGNITIDLDFRGTPPFRITYWILSESSLNLFFSQNANKIKPFEQSLIIRNEVYQRAMNFFAEMAGETKISLVSEFVEQGKYSPESDFGPNLKQVVNGVYLPVDDGRQWAPYSLLDTEEGIVEYLWADAGRSDLEVLTGDEYPEILERLKMRMIPISFIEYLARQELPKYFALNIKTNDAVAGCEKDAVDLTFRQGHGLYLPDMSLVVLSIENTGDEKIGFSKVEYQENKADGLRYLVDDFASLDQAPNQIEERMLPSKELKPGESFVLPLYMFFDQNTFFEPTHLYTDGADYYNAFPYRSYDYDPDNTANLKSNSGLSIDYQRSAPPGDSLRFVLGSSLRFDALWVGNVKYPVRAFDPERLYWEQDITAGASCPFVYTFNPHTQQWEDQGVIIDGYNEKSEEAWDDKHLPSFNGKVLIKEKEPETSFLNCLRVHVYGKAGEEEILAALDPDLIRDDLSYIRLEEGDELMVSFEERKTSFAIDRIVLHAKGYYIPYEVEETNRD